MHQHGMCTRMTATHIRPNILCFFYLRHCRAFVRATQVKDVDVNDLEVTVLMRRMYALFAHHRMRVGHHTSSREWESRTALMRKPQRNGTRMPAMVGTQKALAQGARRVPNQLEGKVRAASMSSTRRA